MSSLKQHAEAMHQQATGSLDILCLNMTHGLAAAEESAAVASEQLQQLRQEMLQLSNNHIDEAAAGKGKIEALVPRPGRFWPKLLGDPPVPQMIISPRAPKGPYVSEIPVDPALLEAGDHNGSTYYQHQRFNAVVRGEGEVEVTLADGAKAIAIGLAAQESARTGQAVLL